MVAVAAASALMAGNPWLDARFGQRRFLRSLLRDATPIAQFAPLHAGMADELRHLWGQWLQRDGQPVGADSVVLCASYREAVALAVGTLLGAGDTLLVAQPCPPQALAIALAQGARYVDVGRRADGSVQAEAARRAAAVHSEAVALAECPGLTAGDDWHAWRDVAGLRAAVCDLAYGGWQRRLPAADASVVCLRDPDHPAETPIWAVAAAPDAAAALGLLWGPSALSQASLAHGLAIARGLVDHPQWPLAAEQRLERAAAALRDEAGRWPGAQVLPSGCLRVAVACAAGDADGLLQQWRPMLAAGAAYRGSAMRDLAVADVAQALS